MTYEYIIMSSQHSFHSLKAHALFAVYVPRYRDRKAHVTCRPTFTGSLQYPNDSFDTVHVLQKIHDDYSISVRIFTTKLGRYIYQYMGHGSLDLQAEGIFSIFLQSRSIIIFLIVEISLLDSHVVISRLLKILVAEMGRNDHDLITSHKI